LVFVGVDWAEEHHDVCVLGESGEVLAEERIDDSLAGLEKLQDLLAEHASDPRDVILGIETDRGLLVRGLLASGYLVYAINPRSVDRYRDRHAVSGAKSDPGDAKVLADVVRTDRHHHRPIEGDSELAQSIRVVARAQRSLIWTRQRQANQLRNLLREFYPAAMVAFGTELTSADALALLQLAPTPERGRTLSRAQIASALRRAGRQRNLETKAAEIQTVLRQPQLQVPTRLARAYGASAAALVQILLQLNAQLKRLEQELTATFEEHPDAEIYRSLPGLGNILGGRVLAEFGDDRTRFAHAKARKNYAGTAPITKASGKSRIVLARVARNRHLSDACHLWAFSSITRSSGARRYYSALRRRGKTHHQALRSLANRLVGILHGCLDHRQLFIEALAWPTPAPAPLAA
jgi:transposase